MRGVIRGVKPIDYPKKGSDERVQGIELHLTYKSGEVFGDATRTEYISKTSPFYKDFVPYLANDMDSLIGAKIFIDIVTEKRGSYTFSEITEVEFEPVTTSPAETKADKKAG